MFHFFLLPPLQRREEEEVERFWKACVLAG
jgi:hypothetical protein